MERKSIEMCVEACGEIDRVERQKESERRSSWAARVMQSGPAFEIPLTAKAISWRWLCCQLLGWLAVKYGGWESATSSPRQPDGWSPRGERERQQGGRRSEGEEEEQGGGRTVWKEKKKKRSTRRWKEMQGEGNISRQKDETEGAGPV